MNAKLKLFVVMWLIISMVFGMSTALCITVVDEINIETVKESPATIAWISDTQDYISNYPDIFVSMAQWIGDNRDSRNIVYLLHTGDIVSSYTSGKQWDLARDILDIAGEHIPVGIAAGNHDAGGEPPDYSRFVKRFGEGIRPCNNQTVYWKDGKGQYDLLDINGHPFIIITMGYNIGATDYNWINQTLLTYSDHIAILAFHSYLNLLGQHTGGGEQIFDRVVKPNTNVRMVLCGHMHGAANNSVELDDNADGVPDRIVYELLADYQSEKQGGGGRIRLLTFELDGSVDVSTYSPWLDTSFDDAKDKFTIPPLY